MGSSYEVDLETARAIRKKMQTFVENNPPGAIITEEFQGETLRLRVTKGGTLCPPDESQTCRIELQHLEYGGYANYELDIEKEPKGFLGRGSIEITGADFPYPAEFLFANKHFMRIVEDKDWCIIPEGEHTPKHCSKRRW